MRQNFLMVKMVKNVEIPKGTEGSSFPGNLFFFLSRES